MFNFSKTPSKSDTPLYVVAPDRVSSFLKTLPEAHQTWIEENGGIEKNGDVCRLPGDKGHLESVVLVCDLKENNFWHLAALAAALPSKTYSFINETDQEDTVLFWAAFAWGMASYRFDSFKKEKAKQQKALLSLPKGIDADFLSNILSSTFWVRTLINLPANIMTPDALEAEAGQLAESFDATFKSIQGESLLDANFPLVHAVGKAGEYAPRFIELNWGNDAHPHLILVGKGVCFDTGGLNVKPGGYMRLMKKDMGGAALSLGLAKLIMQEKLPLRLTVLIPAVENNVGPNSMRPGDIYPARDGQHVEIGHTDAEGRLILADALAYASEKKPALILDLATLTGAARVALGHDVPAVFSNEEKIQSALQQAGTEMHDPVWPLPLHSPYQKQLHSTVADYDNDAGGSGYGGAITAALFLQSFVKDTPWIHMDFMGWNTKSKPGRPIGGEALGMRALYQFITKNFNLTPTDK